MQGRRLTIADLKPGAKLSPVPKPVVQKPKDKTKPLAAVTTPSAKPKRKGRNMTPVRLAGRRRRQLAKLERMGFTETDIETLTATLTERYPNTFAQFRRPLAIGIHTAIIADLGCDPVLLRLVLARWTNNAGYWFALRKQTERYGLDGQPAGTVTDDERKAVLRKLKQWSQRRKARQQQAEAA